MLAALLLVGIVAAPLCSAALFVPVRRPRRVAGAWPATRRLALAVLGTIVVAVVVTEVLRWLPVTPAHAAVAVGLFAAASMAWLPATRRWNARAHLAWVSTVFLFVAYLAFIALWTVASGLGLWGTLGGLLLWAFELIAAVMACAYLWELCDALGTEHWRRRVTRNAPVAAEADRFPFVSLHVPAHNEPPEMVIETLRSLLRIDYPNYEVVVIDDNTEDEAMWRPVQAWCAEHGVTFAHLDQWPGYKSGALNYALGECANPDAEIIGVVDSDYQIDPGFLRRCVPLFADPSVGFIQAPQDYRDWRASAYLRRLYYSYRYFFAVSQPSRNERDGAIFAGTMGLIRKQALVQVGGWDEWCITEDAELSLRLLQAGWSGLHVDASMGHGVMPLTFEALKSQRYRWCFGGIQILRMHLRSLTIHKGLSAGQRWAYLSGALQWYGDLLGLIFFSFLLAGAVNLALGGGQLFRSLSAFLVATVPALVRAGPAPGGRAAAAGHRRHLAGRRRRVLHLAVHVAGGGPGVRAGSLRETGRVPAHAEDRGARLGVPGPAGELGREHAGAVRSGRDRRRTDQSGHIWRAAAGRAARRAHARPGRGAGQQPRRAALHAAAGAGCPPALGVGPGPARHRGRDHRQPRLAGRGGAGRRDRHPADRADAATGVATAPAATRHPRSCCASVSVGTTAVVAGPVLAVPDVPGPVDAGPDDRAARGTDDAARANHAATLPHRLTPRCLPLGALPIGRTGGAVRRPRSRRSRRPPRPDAASPRRRSVARPRCRPAPRRGA